MKKIIFTLVLLISVVGMAMSQNDAVYVYRNDGEFNAFLKSDVDSMSHSHYDTLGTYHSQYVTQVIYTHDSVYRIPLSVIDSVSFVTPETQYQDNVYHITEFHLPYIKSSDDSRVTFFSSFPRADLPVKGQVVISDVYEEPLEFGFAGRVIDIVAVGDSVNIICEEVAITDIYKQLVCVTRTYLTDDESASRVKKKTQGNFNLGTFTVNMGAVSVSDKITGYVDGVCNINPFTHPYVTIIVKHRHEMKLKLSLQKSGTKGDTKFLPGFITIPTGVPGLYAKIQGGGFYDVSGSVGLDVTIPASISFLSGLRWNEKMFKPENVIDQPLVLGDVHTSFEMKGSASFGVAARLSLGAISEKVLGANITLTAGPKLSANFSLSDAGFDDGTLYSSLKDSKITFSLASKLSAGYTIVGKEGQFEHKNVPVSLSWDKEIKSWYLLPAFSGIKVENTQGSKATLSTEISRDLCFLVPPLSVGMVLFDSDDRKLQTQYSSAKYHSVGEWPYDNLSATFENLEHEKTYRCSPVIKFMGFDMVATPKREFKLEEFPVTITSFKQTGADYSPGAYYNDGYYYDYKFEAATSVRIESLEGVADWGYVYEDLYGRLKRISLKQYGISYIDTRYAYYRNEAQSTVRLYGYVKKENDDNYYDDEPHDYPVEFAIHTCPDSNHPHAIDLGLPSGTKWCCMNVGATSPEGYGGYYAWGETSEKSVYSWDNYAYYNSNTWDYIYIGSDIAGTSYDVAHVRMGAPWRMPSHEQQMELIDNCARTWTQQNGVNGILVTGKNGGQIFLPAAGCRWNGGFDYVGSLGYYWSSSLSPLYDYGAYGLYFYSGYWGWSYYDRNNGLSVRAVCP